MAKIASSGCLGIAVDSGITGDSTGGTINNPKKYIAASCLRWTGRASHPSLAFDARRKLVIDGDRRNIRTYFAWATNM